MYFINKWEKEQLDQSALTRTRHIKGVIMQMRYRVKDVKELTDALLTDADGYNAKVKEITEKSRESDDQLKETIDDLLTLLGGDSDSNYDNLESLLDSVEKEAEEYSNLLEKADKCESCFGGDSCNHSSCLYTQTCSTDDVAIDEVPEENEFDGGLDLTDDTSNTPQTTAATEEVTPEATTPTVRPTETETETIRPEITGEDAIREGTYYSPGVDGATAKDSSGETKTTILCQNIFPSGRCAIFYGDDNVISQPSQDPNETVYTVIETKDDLTTTYKFKFGSVVTDSGDIVGQTRTIDIEATDGSIVRAESVADEDDNIKSVTVTIVGDPSPDQVIATLYNVGDTSDTEASINIPYGYFGDNLGEIIEIVETATGQSTEVTCSDLGYNSSACFGTGTSYAVKVKSQQEADELTEKWTNSVTSANTSAASCSDSSACSNSSAAGCGDANASAGGDGSAGCGGSNTTVNTGGDSGGSSSVCVSNVSTVHPCPGGRYNRE